jgi:hypothetical protein
VDEQAVSTCHIAGVPSASLKKYVRRSNKTKKIYLYCGGKMWDSFEKILVAL